MNVFLNQEVANQYDVYYESEAGKAIDKIEKDAIGTYLNSINPCRVLELGCGTGHWSAFLASKGFTVTATDISDAMLEVANSKQIDGTCFRKLDAHTLPFENESWDLVVAITMLEFTPDPDQIIVEMKRILKPGGHLILGCLNSNSVIGRNKSKDAIFKEARFFTFCDIQKILSGFEKVEIKECVYLSSTFEILDNLLASYSEEGVFFAVHAQK